MRDTTWPPPLGPPPASWTGPWTGFVRDYSIGFSTLTEAYTALDNFWRAPLRGAERTLAWHPPRWRWQRPDS